MRKKLAIYTRVSTDKDAQQQSLETQEEHYREYSDNNGYEFYDIYAEKGTATTARRVEFQRLMYDAGLDYLRQNQGTDIFVKSNRMPKIDFIVCKDVSRFSRNSTIGIDTIKQLRDKGVYVIFENAGVTSEDESSDLIIKILFTVAENESQSSSKRIKFSKRHAAKKGRYKPSRLPYGYVKNEVGEIVIQEEQAEIVKYIFDNYNDKGTHVLARELNEMGKTSQQGYNFTGDKVLKIVRNLIYTGTAVTNRSNKKNVTDTSRIANEEKDYIYIANAVPAIITLQQFTIANKKRVERINKSSKRGRKPTKDDIYFGKLYCSTCGSRFTRHIGEKKKITYMCQTRRKGGQCISRGISINVIDRMIEKITIREQLDGMHNYTFYKKLVKKLKEEAINLKSRQDELSQQIEILQADNMNSLQMLQNAFRDGKSQKVKDMVMKDMENKENQIEQLTNKLEMLQMETIHALEKKVEVKQNLINHIKTSKKFTFDEKVLLLKKAVVSDNQVKFIFSMPTFEDEIQEYNSLFSSNPISTNSTYTEYGHEVRREHKEAREHWNMIDEYSIE